MDERLQAAGEEDRPFVDLRQYAMQGVQVVDRYSYRIRLQGKYPQFVYWMAMPFFAPMPWEADRFYAQPGLWKRNIKLDWFPVGTGAFMLTENNPNLRMVLERNPHFHGEIYPTEGEAEDADQRLADRRGTRDAVHRQGDLQPGAGDHPLLEQISAGLLRYFRDLLGQFRSGGAVR